MEKKTITNEGKRLHLYDGVDKTSVYINIPMEWSLKYMQKYKLPMQVHQEFNNLDDEDRKFINEALRKEAGKYNQFIIAGN